MMQCCCCLNVGSSKFAPDDRLHWTDTAMSAVAIDLNPSGLIAPGCLNEKRLLNRRVDDVVDAHEQTMSHH